MLGVHILQTTCLVWLKVCVVKEEYGVTPKEMAGKGLIICFSLNKCGKSPQPIHPMFNFTTLCNSSSKTIQASDLGFYLRVHPLNINLSVSV